MAEFWNVTRIRAWALIPFSELTRISVPNTIITAIRFLTSKDVPGILTQIAEDGLVLDVSSISANFGINEIPSCSIGVAIGRQAQNVNVPSVFHHIEDFFKYHVKVQVWVLGEQTAGETTAIRWPKDSSGKPKPFMVFDGFAASVGVRKAVGSAGVTILLQHWLGDLNFSSMLSNTASVSTPVNIAFDAALVSEMRSLTPNAAKFDVPTVTLQQAFTSAVLEDDFWGFVNPIADRHRPQGGLKEFFRAIASKDMFNWHDLAILRPLCPNIPLNRIIANDASLAAINRFEPLESEQNDYKFGVKVRLKPTFINLGVAGRMAAQIAQLGTARALANVTMWDKLVGDYAQQFMLMVVPLVNRALVVPFTPSLRTSSDSVLDVQKPTIFADEYDYIEMNNNVPRPIRGVALAMDRNFFALGPISNPNPAPTPANPARAGAVFDTCRPGQILVKQSAAWPWLANAPNLYSNTLAVTKAQNSAQGGPPAAPASAPIPDAFAISEEQQLFREMARMLYIQEVLRHRSLRVSGPLRFDFCPGATIAIEPYEDKFVLGLLDRSIDEPPLLHGMIVKMSFQIDAESGRAGTSYLIGFVRSDSEDESDETSTASHPIWDTAFVNAPLVEELANR